MDDKKLLMIFVKNPEKGEVKTRLAASVGNDKAYNIYLKLLEYTVETAENVRADKQIWYSSFVDESDGFGGEGIDKKLQLGRDLGERMRNAFRHGFDEKYDKIVIIGSDCPGVSEEFIEKAFLKLESHNVVIGPSEDGGYYLLGMNRYYPELFRQIEWSTEDVLRETVSKMEEHGISYASLPELNDIDTIRDLEKSNFIYE